MQNGCLGILTSIDSNDVSPLQPICRVALLDHWLHFYRRHCGITDVYVICRPHERSQIMKWARSRYLQEDAVINADEQAAALSIIVNIQATRQHACTAIAHIHTILSPKAFPTLIEHYHAKTGVIAHNITNTAVFSIHDHYSSTPLHAYFTQPNVVHSIAGYQKWCMQQSDVISTMCSIFNLHDSATQALTDVEEYYNTHLTTLPTSWVQKCYARIGLMGNPSDGFNGKTVSFTIENFAAQVTLSPLDTVDIVPHPINDTHAFPCLDQLMQQTSLHGYYGGLRLLRATCKSFADHCIAAGHVIHLMKGFRMEYDSTIPRLVGLSGSSAIIVSAFRALLHYYGLSLSELNITLDEFPQIILNIEKVELGISAGLQDRVIQTRGGLVHMDFSEAQFAARGGDSGKVHSTVRERWAQRDPVLIDGMRELGVYADEAVECLRRNDISLLASLMDKNFAMRRRLYGDEVVGGKNILAVHIADRFGMAGKFTGSGGAILCLQRNGQGWLSDDQENECREQFEALGYRFVRVTPAK